MEAVRCAGHGSLCFLKTGVRDGPSQGKSFYVCGVQDRPPCGFVAPTDLPPSHCLIHEKYIVELQVLIQQHDREEYRLFYRCLKSKKDGKRWCGSIPWQNPKTSQLPTDLGCHHAPALLCNPNGQRNPFRVLNKNCEASSWKQISEDTTEQNTVGGGKQKAEKAQVLDAKEKLTSESVKGRELPAGMKIMKKQSGEKKAEAGEEACSQTKSSQPETQKEGNLSCDRQKRGTCKEPAKLSKHTEKAASATLVEDVLSGEGNSIKPLSSCPKSQKADAALLREEQLRKECSIAHEDKWIEVKGRAGGEICEKSLTARQSVISQETSTTPEPSTSVFMPPGGPLAQAAPPKSGIVPREEKCSSGHSGTNEDEVVFVSPTLGAGQADRPELDLQQGGIPAKTSGRSEQNILSSFPGLEISLPKGEVLDSKGLHSHLQIQLKQKKSTLAAVNVQALPDKGERLLKQVQDLEAALSTLNLSSAESEVEENSRDSKNHDEPLCNTSSSPGTEPTNIMQPKKQQPFQDPCAASSLGLHCRGPIPSLGSSKYYGHVDGVNSSMQNLYGGRMTEDRIRTVRNATSDAIDHLYKSLESCPTEETVAADPSGLRVSLLVHQKQALAWLLWRESQQPCGGILDSPVVLSHGTLIICPASLLHHWKKEIERHVTSGKLRIYLYHGPNRSKDIAVLSKYDIVVTTYSLVSKEVPTKKEEGEVPAEDHSVEDTSSPCSSLLRITWARIILDEAHNIKNPKAQTSLALCRLRANARWAVTGTPIQNNLLDVYSLLRFLRCSPFDEFKVWKYQVDNSTVKGGERLSILTRNLLLRRTKDQLDSTGKPLVSLPQRHAQLHQLKLSEDEQSVYNVLFARSRSTLQSYLKRQEQKSQAKEYPGGNPFDKAQEFGAGQKDVSGGASQVSSTVHVLSMLLRLRQCCCHLSLLKMALDQVNLNSDGISLSLEEQLSALTLCELQSPDSKSTVYLNGTAFNVDLFEVTRQSTKISHLLAELKAIQSHSESQKSVIVSQWTSMLKVVAIHLECLGLKYVTIEGSVNPKERMDIVEEFNTNPKGPQVMLLSLIAGGIGLNLTGGNHLFLLDMHWNPALEDQACDRIYRVGQQKDVVIHRFVCEGTVEEKISELQTRKKNLAQQVLSGTGDSFTKLTLADLKIIFGI
ncbi:PREDICTED: transcription termination factor 2 isoform X2 [Gavialis gangeticus]|uniref:transcription termination factor 2 isoform X2 n=1 Tax=Gavialis gangeticus TaxID=94835 RepID=UPI00092E5944|nr:PREDICTED: transcription termination factor 2 isoform X2 [Gavialis gangeticus]